MREIMVRAVKEAGKILLKYRGSQLDRTLKEHGEIATNVDVEAEKAILSVLEQESKYNIIAEEHGQTERNSEYTWVIDALDGTHNYVEGIPFFCISLALLHHDKVRRAAIYDPNEDELYEAETGKGAWVNGRPISKAEGTPLVYCDRGYSPEAQRRHSEIMDKLETLEMDLKNGRATALSMAHLAAGRAAAVMTLSDPLYDLAAGVLLMREAGLLVTNIDGEQWTIEDDSILAAHQELHHKILALIKD